MFTKYDQAKLDKTLEKNAVHVIEYDEKHNVTYDTLCLWEATEDDLVCFSDRCGELWGYKKEEYGITWDFRPVEAKELIRWDDVAEPIAKAFHAQYVWGEFLTETEEQADRIADLLESLGFDNVITGYDPEQDEGEKGKWYVYVG